MKIVLYRKSSCPCAVAVMGFLKEFSIPFDVRNVSVNQDYAREVKEKFGQNKSPRLGLSGSVVGRTTDCA